MLNSQKVSPRLRFTRMPGLFDDWSLVREWGSVGSPGTVRKEWFDTEEEAIRAGEKLRISKEKNGYRSTLTGRSS